MHIRAINVAICWKEFNLRIRRFRIISCWTLRYNLSEKPKFLYLTIPLTAEVKTFVLRIFLIQLGKCPSVVHLHREEIKRLDSAKAYFGFRFWKKKNLYTHSSKYLQSEDLLTPFSSDFTEKQSSRMWHPWYLRCSRWRLRDRSNFYWPL